MPKRSSDAEDPRRAFVLKALAAGLFAAGATPGAWAQFFGRKPQRLPQGRSVYEITVIPWRQEEMVIAASPLKGSTAPHA